MIPKLRFPEFTDNWVERKLGDVMSITSAARVHKEEWSKSGVPFFRSSDVVSAFKGTKNNKAFIPFELYESLTKKIGRVKKGDLLVTGGGSIGVPYLIENNDLLYFKDADLLWLKSNNKISGYFLYTFFSTPLFRKYLQSITHVGTIAHYTVIQAKNTPCRLPQSSEQQKIASFLRVVDQKINHLTKKKEALETYKKGLMQKIFSQEVRFKRKDGTDYPEWSFYCIAEMGEFFNGLTGKNSSHFGHGDSQYVQYSQVFRNSYINLAECDNVDVEDSEKQNALKVGDALFTTSSEVANEVAFASILLNKPEIDTYLNSFCFGLRLNSLLAPSFAQYLFRTTIFRKAVYPLAQGSTRYNVSKKEVGKVKLLIPSVEEQNHIAKSFKILDSKIEQLILLKKKTEQLKKGLLQQMFV